MNIISVFGLLALLVIAWLMSYHKTQIKMKPIFWGMGLQFLFALIILKDNYWSFVGMGLLGLLIIIYILKKDKTLIADDILSLAIIILFSIAAGSILYIVPFVINTTNEILTPITAYLPEWYFLEGI